MGKKKKNYEKPSKVKRFFDIAMCVMLVIILTFQVLGLIGASTSEVIAIKESKGLIPTWIGAIYLIGMSVLLCRLWKRKEKLSLIPLALGAVGAAMALVVALTLRAALPLQAAGTNVSLGGIQGLNEWRLFWRHYSLVVVGAVAAIVSFIHYKGLRDARVRKENEAYQEAFNFDKDNPLLEKDDKKDKKKSKKERKAEKE
ncbi:MAG: hypothetical protein IKL13_02720 [Clostridia bacterium]|nr:hypothetical protein [Clostridia bacterium]